MANRTACFLAVCCFLTVISTGCSVFRNWTKEGLLTDWSKEGRQEKSLLLQYPHAHEATLTLTAEEHYQAISDVIRRDRIALIDDLDMLFMTDRPTRLTRWHDR